MVSPGPRSYGHRPDLPGLAPHAEALPPPLKHGRPLPHRASAWVPWPTSPGLWWHRTSPGDLAPEPVRAGDAGDGTVHAIYAIGTEEPCFRDGPPAERAGWAFCPAVPP